MKCKKWLVGVELLIKTLVTSFLTLSNYVCSNIKKKHY